MPVNCLKTKLTGTSLLHEKCSHRPSSEGHSELLFALPDYSRSTIIVGTEFSGMEAPIFALRKIGVPYAHLFACEADRRARETIEANCPGTKMYHDIIQREPEDLPTVDVYFAGFPCQPFSAAGAARG